MFQVYRKDQVKRFKELQSMHTDRYIRDPFYYNCMPPEVQPPTPITVYAVDPTQNSFLCYVDGEWVWPSMDNFIPVEV